MAIKIGNYSLRILIFLLVSLAFMSNVRLLHFTYRENSTRVTRHRHLQGTAKHSDTMEGEAKNIVHAATQSKIKIIAMSNINYHKIAFAWYDRLEQLGYKEHVIVATDNATLEALSNGRHRNHESWSIPDLPGRVGRKAIYARRWQYVLQQLRQGVSILLSDVDNIFNTHVPPESFWEWDLIYAYATPYPKRTFKRLGFSVCGGMTWLKATQSTINYVEHLVQRCGESCDDQILINVMLANEMEMSWDQPLEVMLGSHSGGAFKGLPYKERTGTSGLTGQKIKIWPLDFAYRGPMFPDICPGPDQWVAMPENYARKLKRLNAHQHKLSFYNTWDSYCGRGRAATKPVGLATIGELPNAPTEFDTERCLTSALQHLPIGHGRKPRFRKLGRDLVFVHQYDAGNDELWNGGIRFLEIPELRSAPCSVWEIGAHRHASDSRKYMSRYPKCQFHAYEPNPNSFAKLQQKFGGNARMSLHNYGLGERNSTIHVDGNASKSQTKSQIVSIEVALQEAGDQVPTLLHMNCQGCEWNLIPEMIEIGLIPDIKVIQVGWYNTGGGGIGNRVIDLCHIHAKLSQTHRLVDGIPFGWERWVRR